MKQCQIRNKEEKVMVASPEPNEAMSNTQQRRKSDGCVTGTKQSHVKYATKKKR